MDAELPSIGPQAEVLRVKGLQDVAKAVAARYGDKGAIVVTYGPEGIRIGSNGLSPTEAQKALCIAIYYHIIFGQNSIHSWEVL